MANPMKGTSAQTLHDFGKRQVGEIMETNVQSVHSYTKADVIASRMIEGFGAVPVVDNQQRLIGIVSEHDLLSSLNRGQRWGDLTAEDVMTRSPYSIRPETTIATLVHVLQASNLIRVPVVDAQDKLIGIVARRDILRAYLAAGVGSKV
jgi:CBS domain-containing protein